VLERRRTTTTIRRLLTISRGLGAAQEERMVKETYEEPYYCRVGQRHFSSISATPSSSIVGNSAQTASTRSSPSYQLPLLSHLTWSHTLLRCQLRQLSCPTRSFTTSKRGESLCIKYIVGRSMIDDRQTISFKRIVPKEHSRMKTADR